MQLDPLGFSRKQREEKENFFFLKPLSLLPAQTLSAHGRVFSCLIFLLPLAFLLAASFFFFPLLSRAEEAERRGGASGPH